MVFPLVMIVVAGLIPPSGTLRGEPGGEGGGFMLPETDDILDSYAYNQWEQMSTVGASFTDYAAIDDFTWSYCTDADVFIDSYTCWGVTTGAAPTALELLVVENANGVPTGAPLSQESYTTTCGNSGYTYGGYTIWLAVMNTYGEWVCSPVWLGSHRNDGTSWYPLGGTTITGSEGHRTTAAGWSWMSFSASGIPAGDLFKVIGSSGLALERNTWAGIKSSF